MDQVPANESEVEFAIEIQLTQVNDGTDYTGSVSHDGKELQFTLHFAIPIPELHSTERLEGATVEDLLKIFQLTLTKADGSPHVLDVKGIGFFVTIITPIAVDFYNLPQIRASQHAFMGLMMRNLPDASTSSDMIAKQRYKLPKAIADRLESYFS